MRQCFLIAVCFSAGLAALGVSTTSAQSLPPDCAYTFTSGAPVKLLRYCVTTRGNIIYLETGQGAEHIYGPGTGAVTEGYAVCSTPSASPFYYGEYYDDYFHAGFWKFPTTISTSPLVIERTTVDDGFKLRQKFTRQKDEQEVVIEMTLTNVSTITRTNVILKRLVDLNIDFNHTDDVWDRTYYSVWARNGSGGLAITLKGFPIVLPTVQPNFTVLEGGPGSGFPCADRTFPSPPTPVTGDYIGHVGFWIGTMAPSASKTVKVRYGHH